jgi:surface polysaccharide O-acyltransferase-like enzyme
MFTVVMAHSFWLFAPPLGSGGNSGLLLVTAQCAVPTFFITSGYLLRWRDGDPLAVTRWSLRKLIPLYVIWAGLYTLFAWIAGLGSLAHLVRTIGFGVGTLPLWFLPALALALSVISLSLRFLGLRRTWILASGLAALALFNGAYQTFLGFEANPLRGNVMLAPFLVLCGVQIRLSDPPRSLLWFGIAALAAYWLQILDDRLITTASGYSAGRAPHTTLATIPFALSVFLFGRSLPPTSLVQWLAARKRYLIVIYCVHSMILTTFDFVPHGRGIAMLFATTTAAYALSLIVAFLLAQGHRQLRELARPRSKFALANPR